MRLKNIAIVGVAAGAATVGMVATPAFADHGGVLVQPGEADPGQRIVLVAKECQRPGTAGSDAFAAPATLDEAATGGGYAGFAFIKKDAKPGSYRVNVNCVFYKDTATVIVKGGASANPDGNGTSTQYPNGTKPQYPQHRPYGSPNTGIGGAIGDNGTAFMLGGVLLVGAVGIGAMAVRRRVNSAA